MDLPARLRATIAFQRAIAPSILGRPAVCAILGGARTRRRGGRRLDPEMAALLAMSDLDPGSDLTRFPPVEARLRMAASIAVVQPEPPHGVAVEALSATSAAGPIPLRLYTPPGVIAPAPAVVFFHGGGFVTGSLDTHDGLCRQIAVGARCRVVSVDYRLAPEHPFPAAVDDALAAFRWIAQHAGDLGIDAARIAVAGDSAGGTLSAIIAQETRADARKPCLQVLLYPAVDLTRVDPSHAEMGDRFYLTQKLITWFLDRYLPGDLRDPRVSPIFAADLAGLAPALIYTAGFDPLRDEALRYAERLRAAGVPARHWEFTGQIHGFMLMGGVAESARRARDEVIADVRRALGS